MNNQEVEDQKLYPIKKEKYLKKKNIFIDLHERNIMNYIFTSQT
jgi:hypothetical protein